jgi:hypothetical protein
VATAGTHPTSTKHRRAREERARAHKSATEHLQASAEIDKARQKATADVRRSRDSALERMRDVNGGLRQRAEAEPLSGTTRSSMRVIGLSARWATTAVRAQRTPEALKELSDEIRSRRPSWGRRRRRATVPRANRRSPAGGTGERATGRSHRSSVGTLDVMVVDA